METQSIQVVRELVTLFGGEEDKLYRKIKMTGRIWLVLSSKRDLYYMCDQNTCSCKGFQFRGHCKHLDIVREEILKEQPKPREDARPVMSLRETIWAAEQEDLARAKARGVA